MSKYTLLIFYSLFIIACGRDHSVSKIKYFPGPKEIVEVPAPVPLPTEIQEIVNEKNAYRILLGQLPLSPGLTCTIHVTSNPDLTVALPPASHMFAFFGNFNQPESSANDSLNIFPASLRAIYKNGYAIRCQGQIVITESGYYSFELTSDDGSMLYIDSALVVNNNGNHGPTLVVGAKLLERGVHTFRLDYTQTGAGSQALILKSNGVLIPAKNFYR